MSAPDWQSRGSPVADDPAAPAPPDRPRRTTRLFAHPARAFILSGCPPRMNHRPASVATEFFNSLLEVLKQLPPVMAGAIADNPPLYAVLAALLRENEQLYNLYVGYDDAPSLNWM